MRLPRSSRPTPHARMGALLLALLAACSEGPADPDPVETVHSGRLEGHQVWTSEHGPHELVGDVTVESLSIEAGTVVLGHPGAVLHFTGALLAEGTESDSVVFAAMDPDRPWGGLAFEDGGVESTPPSLRFRYVAYQDAERGLEVGDSVGSDVLQTHRADVANSAFRRIVGPAADVAGRFQDVVVDSACMGGCAGQVATLRLGALTASGHNDVELIRTEIRRSGGAGVSVIWRTGITMTDVTITESAGVGFYQHSMFRMPIEVRGTLSITGGGSYPVEVSSPEFLTPDLIDGLRGNARDTLVIASQGGLPEWTAFPGMPWRVGGAGLLRILPGARVHLLGADSLEAIGSPADPVHLSGETHVFSRWTVRHAALENLVLTNLVDGPVVLDFVTVEDSHLTTGSGTRITDAEFEGSSLVLTGDDHVLDGVRFQDAPGAAITVEGSDARITGCVVTRSGSHGILVEEGATGVRVDSCDLFDNAGQGLANRSDVAVAAPANWWGDPAGPAGPYGDGVSGEVQTEPVRTEPIHDSSGTPGA